MKELKTNSNKGKSPQQVLIYIICSSDYWTAMGLVDGEEETVPHYQTPTRADSNIPSFGHLSWKLPWQPLSCFWKSQGFDSLYPAI